MSIIRNCGCPSSHFMTLGAPSILPKIAPLKRKIIPCFSVDADDILIAESNGRYNLREI